MKRELGAISGQQDTERGDGLAEFALILPVLLLILLAIFDLGRAVYAYSVVANYAREGARFGVISPTDQAGITNVVTNAAVGLDLTRLSVAITYPTSDTIRVTVDYTFQVITPLVAQAIGGGGSLNLHSAATMYTGY